MRSTVAAARFRTAASDFDEIWSVEPDGKNLRRIVTNNYSPGMDMGDYRGSFDSLHFSPDSKQIYFLCQNSASNAILYRAARDGSSLKKLAIVHELYGAIGGDPRDRYYGNLAVLVQEGDHRWKTIVMDPDGREVAEIDDPEAFWKDHAVV